MKEVVGHYLIWMSFSLILLAVAIALALVTEEPVWYLLVGAATRMTSEDFRRARAEHTGGSR